MRLILIRAGASATSAARSVFGRFGTEAGLLMFSRILQNGNGFLLSILIVRRFGLAAAGTMAIATVAVVVVGLLGTFGLPYVFARTDAPACVMNTIGFAAAVVVVPLTLPVAALLGLVAGRDHREAMVIALLALGGPFFAQANIVGALQVLQKRAAHSLIPPLANLLGLIVGALLSPSYLMFAALLALFRFSGTLMAFLVLPRAACSLPVFLRHIREGSRFLTADALNSGTDQITVLISSWLMSRGDLGLFGLCRQMLTVSDTPGWSKMQAMYPAVVDAPERVMPTLRRVMLLMGTVCGSAVAAMIVPLSIWVFHQPRLMVLVPLLMASVPLRYLLASYDLHLRATGAVRRSNLVSLIRSVSGVVMITAAAWAGGALGAVLGTIAQTGLAVWVTGRACADVRHGEIRIPVGVGQAPG